MSKSLQEFTQWAIATGKVSNPTSDEDQQYPGQCVSLIQQYLNQVFSIPYAARGNAWSFVPPGFTQLPANAELKPGDVIRYGTNYGGGYGHIGLIDHAGWYLDQNGIKPLRVGRQSKPFTGINAVFRPTKPFKVKKSKEVSPVKETWKTRRNYILNQDAYLVGIPSNKRVAPLRLFKKGTVLDIGEYREENGKRFYRTKTSVKNGIMHGFGRSKLTRADEAKIKSVNF